MNLREAKEIVKAAGYSLRENENEYDTLEQFIKKAGGPNHVGIAYNHGLRGAGSRGELVIVSPRSGGLTAARFTEKKVEDGYPEDSFTLGSGWHISKIQVEAVLDYLEKNSFESIPNDDFQ
jgi:hypothetical protein